MKQESVLKKVSWSALIISILTGALGVALVMYPEEVQQLLAIILAAIALGLGIYHLIFYFASQRKNSMLATDLFLGVILILLGAFMYIRRAELLDYITVIFGLFLCVDCILEIQNAIFVKRLGYTNWVLILLFGFITLVFAVLMILRPQFIQNALMMISGIFLIVSGVTGLITFIMLRVTMHKVKKALKEAISDANAVDVGYEEVPDEDPDSYRTDTGKYEHAFDVDDTRPIDMDDVSSDEA